MKNSQIELFIIYDLEIDDSDMQNKPNLIFEAGQMNNQEDRYTVNGIFKFSDYFQALTLKFMSFIVNKYTTIRYLIWYIPIYLSFDD